MIGQELCPLRDPHQRRLAGTVATQQADSLTSFDLTGNIVKQRRATESNADVVQSYKCHGDCVLRGMSTRKPFLNLHRE